MVEKFDFVSPSLTEELLPHTFNININKKIFQQLLLIYWLSAAFKQIINHLPSNTFGLILKNYYACRM